MAFEALHKARAWLRGDKDAEREQLKKLKGKVFRIDACDRDVRFDW